MGNCGFGGEATTAPGTKGVDTASPYKTVAMPDSPASVAGSGYTPPTIENISGHKSSGPFYCEECKQLITSANILLNEVIEVAGKKYHSACFLCTRCKKTVTGKLVNLEGKRYCEACGKLVREEKKPLCYKCGKRLQGDMISELGQQYHKACFACEECNKKLESFVPYNNKPYCADCARKAQARKNSAPVTAATPPKQAVAAATQKAQQPI